MTTVRRTVTKKKVGVPNVPDPLNSFKVPKKAFIESLLESVALDSADYVDEILPQITQSFRFPQLARYLRIDEAWLVHNRMLEQSFTAARKRLQKSSLLMSSVEANLCTGFCVLTDWTKVEEVASGGLSPGNVPDTWLGQPEQGVTVNQCADIVVARAQKRLQRKQAREQQPTKLYLVVVRWVKSKAYIVASGAEESGDRLEPQPGYACHVSTWSRIDPLDPAKVSLESAYQMSQVYLYEFDEELELRSKPEHVVPYAVVKCQWELNTETASKLESLNPATGSILVISPKPVRQYQPSSSRPALLPTPSVSLFSGPRSLLTPGDIGLPHTIAQASIGKTIESSNLVQLSGREGKSSVWNQPARTARRSLTSGSQSTLSSHGEEKTSDEKMSQITSPLIVKSRKLQASSDIIARLGERMAQNSSVGTMANNIFTTVVKQTPCTFLGVTLLSWGHPKPEFSLFLELYTYRRGKLAIFDSLLQPCLHISRLISHAALHYELAGLTPWPTKPPDPNGPPVLVSIPRDQEWCLPRLNSTTASSLQCDSSPFAGYRGNYFHLTLHDAGGQRTEMSQLCQVLADKALAGVVRMNCDESSVLLLFPDCPFARSISFPPSEGLETNYLHAILLTPYSLDQYPYQQTNCAMFQSLDKDSAGTKFFARPAPIPVPTDIVFSQRNLANVPPTDTKLKMPLDALLSSLPDGGKDLLGTALIALLASRRGSEESDNQPGQLSTSTDSTNSQLAALCNPQTDPRLNRHRSFDTQSLASVLLSTVAKNPELFKRSTTPVVEASATEEATARCTPLLTDDTQKTATILEAATAGEQAAVDPPSAPASPVEQPVENDPSKHPVEPKEIPLSASTPSKSLCKQQQPFASEVVSDSQDMDVEADEPEHREISQTSDMDITTCSWDYGDSPLKYRFNPPTHRSAAFRESRSSFGFPTQVEHLLSDRAPIFESFAVKNTLKNDAMGQTPSDSRGNVNSRQSYPVLSDQVTNDNVAGTTGHTLVFHGDHRCDSEVQLHPKSVSQSSLASSEPVVHLSRERLTKPITVYEDGSKTLRGQLEDNYSGHRDFDLRRKDHSPSEVSKYNSSLNELRGGLPPGPMLVLEDISKTHPFFTNSSKPAAESEEGEVLDDEIEEVDEINEWGKPGVTQSQGPNGDGSYSYISSDASSVTYTLEDEWNISSTDASFSTQCSRSPKPSPPRRNSFRGYRPYYPKGRHTSPKDSEPYESSMELPSRHCSGARVHRSYRSTNTAHSLDNKSKARSSRESFEFSSRQTESSGDKDMRFMPTGSGPYKPCLLPLPSDFRESKTNGATLSHTDSNVSSRTSDNPVRTHTIGSRDVDYRRFSSGGHNSSGSRRSREGFTAVSSLIPDPRHCSSPTSSSSSEHLPRYSVYHPKSDERDRLRPPRDGTFRFSSEPYSSHLSDSSSQPVEPVSKTTEQHGEEPPAKRRTFREQPLLSIPPTLPVNPRGLLPTSNPSLLPSYLRPPLLGGLISTSDNRPNFWTMARLCVPQNTHLYPPPW
ncbi:hypothetical protein T265_02314 [Opisthorchis viverrini]|uniref:TASOR pseudo-PARP domain-containing protein n=1 Tax=Opisthorchis viverrini TaxID=6198 RepID=A0A074ZVA5_OPIVI|nr:hypothetical protein T265_02314 [Opisthorchis viverrini]KER31398.1 hypothetical protein T265_02314 [Opisthorchis viverrini]